MAFTHGRVARAAVVLAVVLTVAGAAVAQEVLPPTVTASDFTDAQQVNTRAFLRAFVTPGSPLEPEWTGTDFCAWTNIYCPSRNNVFLSLWSGEVPLFGTLPEVPADVDGEAVAVTQISASSTTHKLTGTLPASWGRLTRLVRLDLRSNLLTGTLPAEWESMESLIELRLENNRLSGTLPASFLPGSIALVHLNGNGFSGTFPEIWSSSFTLSVLLLHDNQLTGSISDLRGPGAWTAASFSANRLCGCVSERVTDSLFWRVDPALSAPDCATANVCETNATTTTEDPTSPMTTTTTEEPSTSTTTTTTSSTTTTQTPGCNSTSYPAPSKCAVPFCSACDPTDMMQCNVCCCNYVLTAAGVCMKPAGVDAAAALPAALTSAVAAAVVAMGAIAV